MIRVERSAERDAALLAMVPLVPAQGWTVAALRAAAGPDADLLFPGGPADMVEAWTDLADRQMEADAAAADMSGTMGSLGLTGRVRAVVGLRLERQAPHKEAVRQGLAVLSSRGYGLLGTRMLGRTVDSIWHAAGDVSADFSWYTKRAILGAVYGGTLLYWLQDGSEGDAATLAFLDRRLAGLGRMGRARGRVMGMFRPAR